MSERPYEAKDVTGPFQLTATWFLTLCVLDAMFLVAASQPPATSRWLAPVFGFVAVALVPMFAVIVYRLQTRHRHALLADEHFATAFLRELPKARQDTVPPNAPRQLGRRAARSGDVLRGARILWVDDHPNHVEPELRILRSFGVRDIDVRRSTHEALAALELGRYDLILTDMEREGNERAGLELLEGVPEGGPPVIVYLADFDPRRGVPAGAFGITNRPDELINLILDALERSYG